MVDENCFTGCIADIYPQTVNNILHILAVMSQLRLFNGNSVIKYNDIQQSNLSH